MVIRKVRKSDYDFIDALLLQLHKLDVSCRPERFSPAEHYMSISSFESLLENKNVLSILAQQRNKIIGCCFASIMEGKEKTVYIDLLVVDAQHRRHGVGRALFREIQNNAQKLHAERIELMVWSHNPIAECAYRSYGMRPQRTIYEIEI